MFARGLLAAGLVVLAACSSSSAVVEDAAPTASLSGSPGAPARAATTVAPASRPVGGLTPESEPVASLTPPSRPAASSTSVPGSAGHSFPVAIADDQRSLVDAEGRPWLMVGDAGWSSLVMLDEADQDAYLDALAAHHFNTVLVNVIENAYSDHPPFDASGNAPFVGDMYRSVPNEEYWAGFDRYVAAAADRGITVLAAPTYLGYAEDGVAANIAEASDEEMASFGSFLGERYAGAPNIIWVVGGDRTDIADELMQRLESFANALRASSSQLMTAHTDAGVAAADVFGNAAWLQLNTAYETGGAPVSATLHAFEQTPARPTFFIEGVYEQEHDDPTPGNMLLRYQAYGAMLSGAFGHVFGNNPRWHFNSSVKLWPSEGTWQQSLDDDEGRLDLGTRHMTVFADVMRTMPWWTLHPDDGALVTDGRGSGTEQLAAAMDVETGWAAVYTVSSDSVTLDLSLLAAGGAELALRRVDPASGEAVDLAPVATSGTTDLEYPGTNANGDVDWLYVLSPAMAG